MRYLFLSINEDVISKRDTEVVFEARKVAERICSN